MKTISENKKNECINEVVNQTKDTQRANGRYNDFEVSEKLRSEIEDNTTTKKQSTNVTAEETDKKEKAPTKTEIIKKVRALFIPNSLEFDDSEIREKSKDLLDSGLFSAAALEALIEKQRKEFAESKKTEIAKAVNISFNSFLIRLNEHPKIYKSFCDVCKVQKIEEGLIFGDDGKINIYHYKVSEGFTRREFSENNKLGKKLSEVVFIEKRIENNIYNYIDAISSYFICLNAQKKLLNTVLDSDRKLTDAISSVKIAISEGYSLEDITSAL